MVGILSPYLMGPAQGLLAPSAPAAAMAAPMAQQTASTGGGLLARIAPQMAQSRGYQMFDQRRNMIANALLGGVGAESPLERMRGVAQGALQGRQMDSAYEVEARKQQENQRAVSETLKLLTEKRPDLVPWVQSGAISPADAFNAVYKADSKATDDISEYQFAVQQGFQGTFTDYMTEMKKAGAQNITIGDGAPGLGKLSADYGYVLDPETRQPVIDPATGLPRAAPIPGSPGANEAAAAQGKTALRQGQAQVTSDVVIDAANKAREAMNTSWLPTTGTFGNIAGNISETGAAEVRRQVDALKAVAASENINAMRQASPTGGALGNASDADIKLLKDKAGALDPGSPNFLRDLDDYERTLLRIVHGPEVGDAIYKQTRKPGALNDLKTKYGLD